MKLADAYAAEKEEIGDFAAIGYVPPGKKESDGWKTNTFTYTESGSEVWTATSNGKMNDCKSGSTWTVTTSMTAAGNTATAGTLTHVAAVNGENCAVLTPSFAQIGNSQ